MPRRTKGRIYKRGRSKYYWVEYFVNGTRHRESLRVTTLEEAERERDRIVKPYETADKKAKARAAVNRLRNAEEDHAEAVEAARKRLPIADAWKAFEDNRERPQPGKFTIKDYSQRWKKFTDWWTACNGEERKNLEDVTSEDAGKFALHLEGEKLSPNRYNAVISTARMLFTYTLADRANPFAKIRRKRLQTVNHRELTDDELRTVIEAADGEFRSLFIIGVYTLFRLGDCATLQWSNITDDLTMISRKPRKTKTKSNKLVTVGVHPVLREILEQTPPDQRRGDVLPTIAAEYRHDRTKTSRRIQKHFADCGIQMHPENEEDQTDTAHKTSVVGFHSLRHSGASIMSRTGTPVNTLQHLLGHTSAALQSVYVHTTAEDTTKAVSAMPDVTKKPKKGRKPAPSADDILARIRARLAEETRNTRLKRELLMIMEGDTRNGG